jgi:hypothetical protein
MTKTRPLFLAAVLLLAGAAAAAQTATSQTAAPRTALPADAAFFSTADRVMEEMSRILALPQKAPLKKSLRSRDEIREYVLKQLREDKEPAKRYADRQALVKFGLLPKDFDLDAFLVELLTEQIAGLYDPKGGEFYIADWIAPGGQQEMVMAHELTHALHDQHFQVEKWADAAKPNDDAHLARNAVIEGSATLAMLDYLMRGQQHSARDLPNLGPMIRAQMGAEMSSTPQMAKAPPFLRDVLLFPYLAGAVFAQEVLKAGPSWKEFTRVFAQPPLSTQQILHPEKYLNGVAPVAVDLPDLTRNLPAGWKKLDDNVMGEFGTHAMLKQLLDEERAASVSPQWVGDRYAIYEQERTKELALVFRIRFADEQAATRYFGLYSGALEEKYKTRTQLFRRPSFFSFESEESGVFLRCQATECISLEGTTRFVFDRLIRALGLAPAPRPGARPQKSAVKTAAQAGPLAIPATRGEDTLSDAGRDFTLRGRTREALTLQPRPAALQPRAQASLLFRREQAGAGGAAQGGQSVAGPFERASPIAPAVFVVHGDLLAGFDKQCRTGVHACPSRKR